LIFFPLERFYRLGKFSTLNDINLKKKSNDNIEFLYNTEKNISYISISIRLNNLNLIKINSNPDGHCLFHSISIHVQDNYKEIRIKCSNFIYKNYNTYFKNDININELNNYINQMKLNKWGSDIEARAASFIYNKPVIIICESLRSILFLPTNKIYLFDINEDNQLISYLNDSIILLYNGINHYDGLLLK
jgi:hypothetical protein